MKKLRIGILDFSGLKTKISKKPQYLSEVNILSEKIKSLGHSAKLYKVEDCQIFFKNLEAEILQMNKTMRPCDVLIPRVQLVSRLDTELPLLKQFHLMGIPVINQYLPTLNAKNKLRTMQLLTEKEVPVPKTVVVRKFEYLDAAIQAVGGYPVVLKSPFGSYGCGVVIVESSRSLYSALDLILDKMNSNIIMIQEYIGESQGTDYRAFIVGNKVIASMQRKATAGDFRSNLELGGEASKATLTAREHKIALEAAKALGLEIAGVDILRTKNGPVIMEVNANPGFQGIMSVTGVDIAKAIVDYAVDRVNEELIMNVCEANPIIINY
jgi:ribosomal protein S6--L-glutamate ligase